MIPIIISAFIILIIILIWGAATNWQFIPEDKIPKVPPPSNKVFKGTLIGVGQDFKTILKGAIRIENNLIAQIGEASKINLNDAIVIDFGGDIISPGFINAHDHLSYNEVYPQIKPRVKGHPWLYDDRYRWQGLGEPQIKTSYPNGFSLNSMRAIEMYSSIRHILGGTTSIMGSLVGSPGLLRDLSVDCTPSLADTAAHTANPRFCKKDKDGKLYSPFSGFPIQAVGAGISQVLPTTAAWNLRRATTDLNPTTGNIEPVPGINNNSQNWNYGFIEPEKNKDATLIHVGEGIDKYSTGEIAAALKSNFTKTNLSFIHATAISKEQIKEVASRGINVIWSPRSNLSLYGYTTPVVELIKNKVNVSLSTDWIYSGSMNLLREFKCALSAFNDYFNTEQGWKQLIQMVTINPAKATATSDYIGTLDVGKRADISVFKKNDINPYKSILNSSTKDVSMVMVDGDIVLMNKDILDDNLELSNCGNWSKGFMDECSLIPLTICGIDKILFSAYPWSVIRDTINTMYKQQNRPLETSDDINNPTILYPLYFCDEPYNEPSCEWVSSPWGIPRDDVGNTNCFRYPCINCEQLCGSEGGCVACLKNGNCQCAHPSDQVTEKWCKGQSNMHMSTQWCKY